jgi:hypothetical protein
VQYPRAGLPENDVPLYSWWSHENSGLAVRVSLATARHVQTEYNCGGMDLGRRLRCLGGRSCEWRLVFAGSMRPACPTSWPLLWAKAQQLQEPLAYIMSKRHIPLYRSAVVPDPRVLGKAAIIALPGSAVARPTVSNRTSSI